MGGVFGVASRNDCVQDLFYGTDYHSHLGTHRGGLAVLNGRGFARVIHNIENTQFRSKFRDDVASMEGNLGIGVISDTDAQPLTVGSHLGTYALATVGRINNLDALVNKAFREKTAHFLEMDSGSVNQTELVATLINLGETFEAGIRFAQESIEGSCTMLVLSDHGIYAARDRCGRTPLFVGEKASSFSVSMETCAFPNLDFRFRYPLGPGEIVLVTPDGFESRMPAGDNLRICSFLWIYYGYPASSYEGRNVEAIRYRCGAALARRDTAQVDLVAGIPDSGTSHAIGYANQAGVPYSRPFVKYTPTWPRSFMPQIQEVRDLVARMKLIPVWELIHGKRLLFCEDSIVRGTQLQDTIQRLYEYGAKEVHMRPACPPLIYSCPYLNFSRSRSEMDLAGRRAVFELEGPGTVDLAAYADPASDRHAAMVDRIRTRLNLSTLRYQTLPDMVDAIGLPKENLCTHCWDGFG